MTEHDTEACTAEQRATSRSLERIGYGFQPTAYGWDWSSPGHHRGHSTTLGGAVDMANDHARSAGQR